VKNLFLSSTAVACLAFSPVMAADMPVKAPQAVVTAPAAYNWTGWYVGGHVGGGWTQTDTVNVNGNAAFPAGTQHSSSNSGWLAGIQAGFNYQLSPNWVVGIEGDYSWAGIKGDDSRFSDVPGFTTNRLSNTHGEVDWLATVTGRLGYAVNNSLFYAKGGAAWAHKTEDNNTTDPTAANLVRTLSNGEDTRTGWTVGAGWEYGFAPNWSAKIEYNYMDFGSKTEARTPTYLVGTGVNPLLRDVDFHIHAVKAGVNYRFNWMR
jgi:outer membrane immunogenic protein